MKYYHETRTIGEYSLVLNYDIKDIPINTPIYGFAYEVNDDTDIKRLACKPVLGEVIENEGISCRLWCKYVFIPYKVGTSEKRKSGYVNFDSRCYADTYEEAVEMYNELVQQRIDRLKSLIESAEDDKIVV